MRAGARAAERVQAADARSQTVASSEYSVAGLHRSRSSATRSSERPYSVRGTRPGTAVGSSPSRLERVCHPATSTRYSLRMAFSRLPPLSTSFIVPHRRRSIATTVGSNCVPLQRTISAIASSTLSRPGGRAGRSSSRRTSRRPRRCAPRAGSSVAGQPIGDAASVEPLVVRAHDVQRCGRVAEQRREDPPAHHRVRHDVLVLLRRSACRACSARPRARRSCRCRARVRRARSGAAARRRAPARARSPPQ